MIDQALFLNRVFLEASPGPGTCKVSGLEHLLAETNPFRVSAT